MIFVARMRLRMWRNAHSAHYVRQVSAECTHAFNP